MLRTIRHLAKGRTLYLAICSVLFTTASTANELAAQDTEKLAMAFNYHLAKTANRPDMFIFALDDCGRPDLQEIVVNAYAPAAAADEQSAQEYLQTQLDILYQENTAANTREAGLLLSAVGTFFDNGYSMALAHIFNNFPEVKATLCEFMINDVEAVIGQGQ